nr:ribonuclease H-like domain-containing protein [Tanacetum cinerariifolium]
MTGNISYLSEYEPYIGGYVSFGHGGGKITGKGIIKTGKLEFENVYFMKELMYNLFSVSQICDNKNSIMFTDSECIVLGKDFKLKDDTNVLLRTPKQHNMYSIDLNNIFPYKNLTCLVAKASVDESMLWHRRLGHLNFKTMNKLVRNNLVKGLPSKCFKNDHTCIACLKRKQHKASCKTKCDNGGEFKNKEMDEFCTKKGIRREFRNAGTPQQNRIAERRNKTLIEAARTMLADAKLLVTFWAEVVNTAYHLGKFDAKRDEAYFIGYSLSSKAFRVFNKRTKKVEENLHVDFLENKLIEKGASPNWLFNIDTLTNLMNYVPVVVAGTSSTNISGTKDVACQAVKKDVTSLRYIALPNWFHKAHMETSNDTIRISDAQDDSQKEQDCNADVPKNSGISNPTATSKVPSADQVDPGVSLTVEYDILNVSSPVPTVCLDTSPESSSGSRLFPKGVFSQEEASSLGNTLTLSNGFEDTFGDTSNATQMYVKSAFLYGTIDEEVYVMQPPGFQDPEFPGEFEALMHDKFRMSAMGELTFFLVLQVLQKKDGIFLSQDKFIGDILKKFGYSDVRSMIRSLMYLTASRPDIMFAVCACARYQVTPKVCHLHAVKRIFRYLKGHPKLGLWYPKESPFDLVAYSDSDYGGATQDRKSTTGGCQFCGKKVDLMAMQKADYCGHFYN